MLHFAQTGIALLAAGGAVLIVAGLVRESLPGNGRHLHLFPDAHDPPESPAATPVNTVAAQPIPFPHSRGENAHHDKRGHSRRGDDGDAGRKGKKKKRRNKKRDRGEHRATVGGDTTAAEAEDT